jgi:hypothetical protein
MLLRHRSPGIDPRPAHTTKGLEHLRHEWIAILRWLSANHVEYVLVGAAAEAIRGRTGAQGAVAIVPAPYGRNFDRLARALWSAHARLRVDGEEADSVPVKMTAEKLARGPRWTLRCGAHDLDIEGRPPGVPSYQELLYEAGRFEVEPGLHVEVAAPEDIEHYSHVRRTGSAPEIKISRTPARQPERGLGSA